VSSEVTRLRALHVDTVWPPRVSPCPRHGPAGAVRARTQRPGGRVVSRGWPHGVGFDVPYLSSVLLGYASARATAAQRASPCPDHARSRPPSHAVIDEDMRARMHTTGPPKS
jgi:hypothetical protein